MLGKLQCYRLYV